MARPGKVSRRGRTPAEDKRPERPRRYEYLFLIVCEDEATEPAYFDSFLEHIPPRTIYLRTFGTGRDPLGVVEQAQLRRDELQLEGAREVDEVWVVFDKDDADAEPGKTARFTRAEQLAQREGFKLAFSNEVFELWLLLHLADIEMVPPLPRQEVYRRLQEVLRQQPGMQAYEYVHQRAAGADVIRLIQQFGNENLAQRRAETLLAGHGDQPLLATNPSTRVHLLVHRLRTLIDYYSYQA